MFDTITVEQGEFHTADPSIRQISGIENFNLKFGIYFDKKDPGKKFDKYFVVSEDGDSLFSLDSASRSEVSRRLSRLRGRGRIPSRLHPGLSPSSQSSRQSGALSGGSEMSSGQH